MGFHAIFALSHFSSFLIISLTCHVHRSLFPPLFFSIHIKHLLAFIVVLYLALKKSLIFFVPPCRSPCGHWSFCECSRSFIWQSELWVFLLWRGWRRRDCKPVPCRRCLVSFASLCCCVCIPCSIAWPMPRPSLRRALSPYSLLTHS